MKNIKTPYLIENSNFFKNVLLASNLKRAFSKIHKIYQFQESTLCYFQISISFQCFHISTFRVHLHFRQCANFFGSQTDKSLYVLKLTVYAQRWKHGYALFSSKSNYVERIPIK